MELTLNPARLIHRSPAPQPRSTSAPAGDRFTPSSAQPTLVTAQQVRQAAAGNVLSQVPTTLVPMGLSKYHASAKISIFTIDLGEATSTRSDSEIDVHTSKGDAKITVDGQNPNLVDVAVPGSTQTYQATLQQSNGGIVATTTDGKTVSVMPNDSGGMDIVASGFSQVPSGTTVVLTPE